MGDSVPTYRKPVCPEDHLALRFILGARLRPGGEESVYSLMTYSEEAKRDVCALWLVDHESGRHRRLTAGASFDSDPCWSPDGQHVCYVSDKGGGARQLYVITRDGKEERPLAKTPYGIASAPVWSPGGERVAAVRRLAPTKSDVVHLTRAVPYYDGLGNLDAAVGSLAIGDIDGDWVDVADDGRAYSPLGWSPDGKTLYAAARFNASDRAIRNSLVAFDLSGGVRTILHEWAFLYSIAVSSSGQFIMCLGEPSPETNHARCDLWRVPVEGDHELLLVSDQEEIYLGLALQADMPCPIAPTYQPLVALYDDDRRVLVQAQRHGCLEVWSYPTERPSRGTRVLGGDRSCMPLDCDGRTLLYGVSTLNDPLELWITSVSGSQEKQVSAVNGPLLARRHPLHIDHLSFRSTDGCLIEGWYLRPPEGSPPYPSVLYVHGGPQMAFGHAYGFDFQMLAGAGMGVLLVNQRGSTGYGAEFAGAISGALCQQDAEDLIAGVKESVRLGLADPQRVGCCGISAGGYTTCWLVSTTDLFHAAVAENPVTNWHSYYGTADIAEATTFLLGGRPWEIPDVYSACSPITYAHQCRTPVLLLAGEADHRCPIEQAEQFYGYLKAVGCPVEMIRFPGASHEESVMGNPAIRDVQNRALLWWMRSHLLMERAAAGGTDLVL